jgi:hypothetical protein
LRLEVSLEGESELLDDDALPAGVGLAGGERGEEGEEEEDGEDDRDGEDPLVLADTEGGLCWVSFFRGRRRLLFTRDGLTFFRAVVLLLDLLDCALGGSCRLCTLGLTSGDCALGGPCHLCTLALISGLAKGNQAVRVGCWARAPERGASVGVSVKVCSPVSGWVL